ncbi:general substrate transporter [Apodospora peruviana]|uniref:General substrate transporter n=1 Tax=Apodospora peruviana TaxID=516989 RepID=A0AAE0I106_9PEZI|nr:general substrate transporter [Apodospora peruviana]
MADPLTTSAAAQPVAAPQDSTTLSTQSEKKMDMPRSRTPSNADSNLDGATISGPHESDLERGAMGSVMGNEKGTFTKDDEQPEQLDPNVVAWDGPDDPTNPMNWSMKKKWLNIAVLSILTLITPLGSSMFAPAIPKIMAEFHETSSTTATFILSIYILGFAFGPLIIAPMSEIFGRSLLYNLGNIFFTIFTVATALSTNIGMMMAFRFLMGFAGAVPITIGSGSISDLMPVEMRGRAMAAWALGPLLGPCIGPIAGGYLGRAAGWRWVFWLIAILAGVITIFTFFTLKETYAPLILERKTKRLRKETGNQELHSIYHDGIENPIEKIKSSITRPMVILFTYPIVFLMALYVAITYGILYLLFTTFSFVYAQKYGFGEGESGLTFLPAGLGMMIGIVVFGALSDKVVAKRNAAGEEHKPEIRILPSFTLPAGIALPVGLFLYGWTTEKGVHWIVPMIGVVIFAAGLMGIMMCVQNYLLDAYPRYAASVTAALAVLRSLAGALLPLGGLEMYNALGLGWGNSLLGFISLALIPIPFLFYLYGERIRSRSAKK